MKFVRTGVLLCVASLLLSACGRKSETFVAPAEVSVVAPAPAREAAGAKAADAKQAAGAATPEEDTIRRYIALRHEIQLATDAATVEQAWTNANQACVAAGCDILSSTLTRDSDRRPAVAMLEARVPARGVDTFLAKVTALGTVVQHRKSAEDKTDEVVDVEARIRNMTEFRDGLRRLMGERRGKLSELIELERELVRVQSDLDSLASRRKVLANETEKVHFSIDIRARSAVLQRGMWTPVREAVLDAGHMFATSVAGLVSVIAFVLPWLVVLLVLFFGVRAIRRRMRKTAPATQDVVSQEPSA